MVGPTVFLASDAASYVTGTVLFVEGGWTAADGGVSTDGDVASVPDFTLSSEAEEVRLHREEIAEMLMDFFPNHTHCWQTKESALKEVDESLGSDVKRISLVAISGTEAIGWVGGIQMYSHAFELHPMVVRRDWQGRGVGRALGGSARRRSR